MSPCESSRCRIGGPGSGTLPRGSSWNVNRSTCRSRTWHKQQGQAPIGLQLIGANFVLKVARLDQTSAEINKGARTQTRTEDRNTIACGRFVAFTFFIETSRFEPRTARMTNGRTSQAQGIQSIDGRRHLPDFEPDPEIHDIGFEFIFQTSLVEFDLHQSGKISWARTIWKSLLSGLVAPGFDIWEISLARTIWKIIALRFGRSRFVL